MKDLKSVAFDPAQCERELAGFGRLLKTKKELSERSDILPFFRKCTQLSAFLGTFVPDIGPANQIAFEYSIFGDFGVDLLLGSRDHGAYCLIEFEDGHANSLFAQVRNRSTKAWGSRFERGFSQLIDWFYSLDDFKKTHRFAKDFGHGHIKFFGILVVGRNVGMTAADRTRLNWRSEKVLVDSHPISCLTFDDLYQVLRQRMSYYRQASKFESGPG